MQDFTKGNVTRQIVAFSVPMLIGNVFQQVYSMVDAMVVGRFVSGNAMAAVGTSDMTINFLLAVLIGLTTGASVVISQFFGAKDDRNLQRTVSTSVIFLAALSLVISVVTVAFTPVFLRLLDVPEDIMEDAVIYLRIIMGGMIFSMFYNVYSAYLRSLGDSKRPLYILIFASILNLLCDLLFVIVFQWGVAGAALATVFSQAISAVLCYVYASKAVPMLKIKKLVFDSYLFRQILRYSLPAAVQMSITSLASLFIVRLVNSFGAGSIAGYTAATKIDQFAMMPLNSISMAISTFVAQNVGAGQMKRAIKGLWTSMLLMLGLAVVIPLLIFIFKEGLLSLFVDAQDPSFEEIVAVGSKYLTVIVSFYVLFGVFFAFNGFFRGVGDAVIVMILTISSLSIRTIFSYLLVNQFGLGVEAVAWAIPIGWGLCGFTAFLYYRRGLWRGKAIVAGTAQEEPAES